MFGYHIFSSQPVVLTRFEASDELKPIAIILSKLRKKEAELKRAKSYRGAESIDFAKHTVISKLLEDMDEVIAAFNESQPPASRGELVQEMMALAVRLEGMVKTTMLRDADTLKKFRDSQHATLARTADWTLFAGSIAALYAMPFSLLVKLGIYVFGMKNASNAIMDYSGLTADEARSMIILKGLRKSLHDTYIKLRRTIHPEFIDAEARQRARHRNADEEDDRLFLLSEATQQYVDSMCGRVKNSETVAAFKLTPEQEDEYFGEFLDPITATVMDIPVCVNEKYFDLDTLLRFPVKPDGSRENPLDRNPFFARDIQPARSVNNAIVAAIENLQKNPLHSEENSNLEPAQPASPSLGM